VILHSCQGPDRSPHPPRASWGGSLLAARLPTPSGLLQFRSRYTRSLALLGFIAAALVLLLIPGPAVFYVVARSINQGYRAGLISALDLSAGGFVHIAAAAAGLSAILLASATAFGVIKAFGTAYLIYLGLRTLLVRHPTAGDEVCAPRSPPRLFLDGMVVSVLNPKLGLFFLAFLPQFVDPSRGRVPEQVLLLGGIYIGLALITDSTYALLAGSLRQWLESRGLRGPLPRYLAGTVYLGLGVGTALTGRRH
jgi:threonine/homoserine/homoserine lactone efflux protein